MIQHSKIFPKQRHHNHLVKSQQPGFLTAEALVASVVFSILLTGAVKIIERQNQIYTKTIVLQKIYNVVAQDSKAIRHSASIWNSTNVNYETFEELPPSMLYNSSTGCVQLHRRGALESAYRSDSSNYNRIFLFAPTIQNNNVVIAGIPDNLGNIYRVRRTYINSNIVTNPETDPYTIRVKYTTELINSANVVTPFSFEHTMDVNLVAQYSC